MDLSSGQLQNNTQWELRKEIEKFKDEMKFKERDWKKERNELKERIKKLETNWEHYNNNRQNNIRQLEQENNTKDTSSLTFTLGRSQLQSIRPTTYSRTESTRGNDNLTAGPSGTSKNVQSHNSNVSEPSGSNRPNVANAVSNIRGNNAFRVTLDDVNRSANKLNQSAPGNSRNVNNIDDDSAKIICKCRRPAIRFVQKEGPCKDRLYYKCAFSEFKPYRNYCDFFWEASDNVESQETNEYSNSVYNMNRNNAGAGTSNNNSIQNDSRGNTNQSNSNSRALERPTTNRRCTNCKREGHTRNNCPNTRKSTNCRREGHTRNNCPTIRRCGNCREEGHTRKNCPNVRMCGRCREEGHTRNNCSNVRRCGICREEGHTRTICPKRSDTSSEDSYEESSEEDDFTSDDSFSSEDSDRPKRKKKSRTISTTRVRTIQEKIRKKRN